MFKDLEELRHSKLFMQSMTQYAPGYEANSLLTGPDRPLTDPEFQKMAADGSFHALDDLRLSEKSPARHAAIELPSDLQALDNDALTSHAAVVVTIPASRDIGCYRFGSEPLQVGVHGQRRFPIIGTVPLVAHVPAS